MNRLFSLFLTLLLVCSSSIYAQTEAEGISEVLIFQENEGTQTVEIKPGDKIKIHQNEDSRNDVMADVTSVHENSLEIYVRSKKSNYIVDLRKISGISSQGAFNDGQSALIIGGVLTPIFLLVSLLIASSGFFFAPVLFLFTFLFFLMGLAFLMVGLVRRRRRGPQVLLKFWTWRLVRKQKVIVKKKAG